MILTPCPTTKKQFIKHPNFENLFVIPYVKRRLVFSEIVARAIQEDNFDLVLVDLPYFLNTPGFKTYLSDPFPWSARSLLRGG